MNRTELTDLLFRLSSSECILAGQTACALALEKVRKYSPRAHFDRMGNIIAPVAEASEGKEHILLDAHIDEIGFVVTSIDKDGFLRVGEAGGPDLRVLQAHEVTVLGSERLFGVFCSRPPHLASADDYKRTPPIGEMAIDIGFSHDEAAKRVSPGDFVFLRRSPARLHNGMVTGKALDNRAGAAAVLAALDLLDGEKFPSGLTAVFSLSEEEGERGATVSSFAVAPTAAVVVDVSFGLTPDSPKEKCGEMGKGPMIGISPALSREVAGALFKAAERGEIPCQREIMPGDTGTNASVISVSGEGVKTGTASIPLRYMHTAAEVVCMEDIGNTAKLLAEFVRTYGKPSDH